MRDGCIFECTPALVSHTPGRVDENVDRANAIAAGDVVVTSNVFESLEGRLQRAEVADILVIISEWEGLSVLPIEAPYIATPTTRASKIRDRAEAFLICRFADGSDTRILQQEAQWRLRR